MLILLETEEIVAPEWHAAAQKRGGGGAAVRHVYDEQARGSDVGLKIYRHHLYTWQISPITNSPNLLMQVITLASGMTRWS